MPFEYTPPKYAQVISELQRRIEDGEYPPGSLLPSENQLSAEFSIARPTVVRALRILRQEGWIETQQGKGSFVRGRPALAGLAPARRGQAEMDRDEAREDGELVSTRMASPPRRIAALLGTGKETALARRQRLIREDAEPSELVTWWVPAELAEGTDLLDSGPVHGGIRGHLSRVKGVRVDHVVEHVTARHPTPAEARLLDIGKTAPVLVLCAAARDVAGEPLFALEVAMPGDTHELEDAYQIG
jgi:GntR family transcriptional regulator